MSDMNEQQRKVLDLAFDLILGLPWTERSEVFNALRFNGAVCMECGWGEPETPNSNCQCQNDE